MVEVVGGFNNRLLISQLRAAALHLMTESWGRVRKLVSVTVWECAHLSTSGKIKEELPYEAGTHEAGPLSGIRDERSPKLMLSWSWDILLRSRFCRFQKRKKPGAQHYRFGRRRETKQAREEISFRKYVFLRTVRSGSRIGGRSLPHASESFAPRVCAARGSGRSACATREADGGDRKGHPGDDRYSGEATREAHERLPTALRSA
jgi:hypothetical protein